jgi:hypothetical protein
MDAPQRPGRPVTVLSVFPPPNIGKKHIAAYWKLVKELLNSGRRDNIADIGVLSTIGVCPYCSYSRSSKEDPTPHLCL